jgi:fatty acid desaturase
MIQVDAHPKPRLPRDLYRPSTAGSVAFIAYSMLLHYGSAAAIFFVLRSSASAWVIAPAVVALSLVAGQGLHLYGWVGHEAFHGGLFARKWRRILTGVFVTATIPGVFCVVGYYAGHWNHHLHTNTDRDPDVHLHSYRSLWSKLLLLRFLQNGVFRQQTITLARGKELPFVSKMPMGARQLVTLARFNLAVCVAFLALHIALLVMWPLLGVCLTVFPLLGAFVVSGPRPFAEHGGLDAGLGVDSRTRASRWATLFYVGNNFHLEHHLYPSVPCYKLPRVHRFLTEQRFFEGWQAPVETSLAGGLKHILSRYPQGRAGDGAPMTADEAVGDALSAAPARELQPDVVVLSR